MGTKRDYYEILGVSKSTSKDEIKKAYRKLAMQYHPDKNPGNAEAEAKFKEASEAAEVLLDDQKKARYDQMGHAAFDGSQGFGGGGGFSGDFQDLGDIFGDIFGDFSAVEADAVEAAVADAEVKAVPVTIYRWPWISILQKQHLVQKKIFPSQKM